jgi:hypothetical protein
MTRPAIPVSMAARVALAQIVPSALNPRRSFEAAMAAEAKKPAGKPIIAVPQHFFHAKRES